MAELFLDLGMDCGWAISWRDGHMTHGVKRFRRVGTDRVVFRAFRLWLIATEREIQTAGERLELVAYEYVDFIAKTERQHQGPHTYGGFRALALAWCETNGIPHREMPWDEIKKHITGIRNAAKPLVTKRIETILGVKDLDHNEADAIAAKFTAHNEHQHRNTSRPPHARQADARSD